MDHSVRPVFPHQVRHVFVIADIGPDENVVRFPFHVPEVLEVARVGELIDVDDPVIGVFRDEKTHHVASDEARASRDDDVAFEIHLLFLFFDVSDTFAEAVRQWGITIPNVSLIFVLSSTE